MTEYSINTSRLPWHQDKWEQVNKLLERNRFPHALLLSGLGGQGKNQFALQLSQLLLCQNSGQIACNRCSACQLFVSKTHPDFVSIMPSTQAQSIKVEQIRQLNSTLIQSSYNDNPKVVVINLAEQMTRACANALLKLLEEPPRACVFLLISEKPDALLPTVISRCQRWHFAPLHEKDYQQLNIDYDPLLLGSPLARAFELDIETVVNELIAVAKFEKNPIEVAAKWMNHDWSELVKLLYYTLSDSIKFSQGVSPRFYFNNKSLTMFCQLVDLTKQHLFLREIYEISTKVFHNTIINKQLLLESLLIGLNYDE